MNDFPRGYTELSKDARPIESVHWASEYAEHFRVGRGGCTRIVAYDESGSMANVPWLAVCFGDEIRARIPAEQVSVFYKVAPAEERAA